MRVLHWGTYDLGKPRARILREGIRSAGASLQDCHRDIWSGLEDKTQAFRTKQFLWRLVRWLAAYPALIWRFLAGPRPDMVLTSFPGLLDIIVLAPFARMRGVPMAWDMFISVYDTLVFDRGLARPGTLAARCLFWLERFAIGRADFVFLDTEAHARRIESLFDLPPGSCGSVWVGAEVEHFQPTRRLEQSTDVFEVLFYGQFIPLHGVQTIVEAARLMQDSGVAWTLIGRGQEVSSVQRTLAEAPVPALRWIDWVDYAELGSWIAKADLCLGIFGTSEKAASVIPNKVFQIVAAGRPVVTRDSPAVRELLEDSAPCVYLIPPGDPHALAEAVTRHMHHVSRFPAPRCHGAVVSRIAAPAIGRRFMQVVVPAVTGS